MREKIDFEGAMEVMVEHALVDAVSEWIPGDLKPRFYAYAAIGKMEFEQNSLAGPVMFRKRIVVSDSVSHRSMRVKVVGHVDYLAGLKILDIFDEDDENAAGLKKSSFAGILYGMKEAAALRA